MFLVHCHLHFSALTQTVVGEDGRDLLCTFCSLDEDCWFQGEGCAAAMASCLPPTWGLKKLNPHHSCPENSIPLTQREDMHKGLSAVGFLGLAVFSYLK